MPESWLLAYAHGKFNVIRGAFIVARQPRIYVAGIARPTGRGPITTNGPTCALAE